MDITNTELIANPPREEILETKTLGIDGMTCDSCVETIERALLGHPGVKEVLIDRENSLAQVTFDTRQTNIPELHETLLHSGYKATRSIAA